MKAINKIQDLVRSGIQNNIELALQLAIGQKMPIVNCLEFLVNAPANILDLRNKQANVNKEISIAVSNKDEQRSEYLIGRGVYLLESIIDLEKDMEKVKLRILEM